jgi:Inosine-uridine preferring nucleoside hydrolase
MDISQALRAEAQNPPREARPEGSRSRFATMSGMPKRIVLDVDTGTDDALAILYTVRHPDIDILGISCVLGNAEVDQV